MCTAVITHSDSTPILDLAKYDFNLMSLFMQIFIVRDGALSGRVSFILYCFVGNPRGLFLILPGMVIGTLYNLAIVYILYFALIRHSVRYMREKRL